MARLKLQTLVYQIIAIFALIFILEVALRISGYKPSMPTASNSFFPKNLFITSKTNDTVTVKIDPQYSSVFHINTFSLRPKEGTFRVISLGGSSTYGWGNPSPIDDSFSAEFARLYGRMFPSKKIECINLGGNGYGSYRVAALFGEIVRFEPDLVLIYSGHNEFWEYPLFRELFERQLSVFKATKILSRLRLFVLANDLSFRISRKLFEIDPNSKGNYEIFHQKKYDVVKKRYHKNLSMLAQSARKAGVPIIFSTLSANLMVNPDDLHDWLYNAPFHRADLTNMELQKWEKEYSQGVELFKTGNNKESLLHFLEAIKIDPQYSKQYWYLGHLYINAGDYINAYDTLWKHIELSRRLITRELNDIILDVAKIHDVPVVDCRSVVENASKNNLPGYDFFVDSMHPNTEGHKLIGQAFFDKYLSLLQ